MHSILWASILASAGVALFTTLLVEYLAKPWLEVRKDRILEHDRQRRAAIKTIKQSTLLVATARRLDENNERNDGFLELLRRNTTELYNTMVDLYQTIDVPQSVRGQWARATATIAGLALAIQDPAAKTVSKESRDDFKTASRCMRGFAELLTTSKWHPWRKRTIIKAINSLDLPRLKDSEGNNILPD